VEVLWGCKCVKASEFASEDDVTLTSLKARNGIFRKLRSTSRMSQLLNKHKQANPHRLLLEEQSK
jgi:hypothetical protein